MKIKQWKIKKTAKVCASAAGGVPTHRDNSLPPWKNHAATTLQTTKPPARRCCTLPTTRHGTGFMANNLRKSTPKLLLTGKVIGRYKEINHWLVLSL